MNRPKLALGAVLVLAALSAHAQAPSGYIVGGGLGTTECPGFLEAMAKSRGQKPGATGYAGDLQGFAMYVSGFQTAYNLQTPETCDIFAGWNNNQVLDALEKYCKGNPRERFGAGVIALVKERYPSRSKKCG